MPITPLLGELMIFAGNFAPRGWASCSGQLLPISQNTALFSILGTTFGGNGTTTFALPDLRSRISVSSGQGPGLSPYELGEITGQESVGLTLSQIPSHGHSINAVNNGQTNGTNLPSATVMLATAYAVETGNPLVPIYSSAAPTVAMAPNALANTGLGQSHPNIMPSLTLTWCIALQGIFPSRN